MYRRHGGSVSSWGALEGTRFEEERRYYTPMVEEMTALGWTKAAQTSTVLGIIGLACIVTLSWWLFGLPSLILGVIGIFKANEAAAP